MVIITDYQNRRNQVLVLETGNGGYAIDGATAVAITEWVYEHQLGRRRAYDVWQLKNRAAVAMFVLRWS
jgi:hypothetical protein